MSLCCCSAATGRGVLLPSLLLGRRHRLRHPLVNLRTIATFASSSSAAATTSSLSPPQQRQVTIYVDTLLEWNQVRPEPLSSAATTPHLTFPRHGMLPTAARRCPARASLTLSNLSRG